jgi:hypothetical protein
VILTSLYSVHLLVLWRKHRQILENNYISLPWIKSGGDPIWHWCPDVGSLMQQIVTAPGTWCAAIDMKKCLFIHISITRNSWLWPGMTNSNLLSTASGPRQLSCSVIMCVDEILIILTCISWLPWWHHTDYICWTGSSKYFLVKMYVKSRMRGKLHKTWETHHLREVYGNPIA